MNETNNTTETTETTVEMVEVTISLPKTWTHTSYVKGSQNTEVSWQATIDLSGINQAFAEHLVNHALKQKTGDAFNSKKFTDKEIKAMDAEGVTKEERAERLAAAKQENLEKVVKAIESNKVPSEGEKGDPMKKAEQLLGKLTPEQVAALVAKLGQ